MLIATCQLMIGALSLAVSKAPRSARRSPFTDYARKSGLQIRVKTRRQGHSILTKCLSVWY
jgi:hypothetical protein